MLTTRKPSFDNRRVQDPPCESLARLRDRQLANLVKTGCLFAARAIIRSNRPLVAHAGGPRIDENVGLLFAVRARCPVHGHRDRSVEQVQGSLLGAWGTVYENAKAHSIGRRIRLRDPRRGAFERVSVQTPARPRKAQARCDGVRGSSLARVSDAARTD